MSLALTHTPEQVQFYCLDFGGGTLAGLRELAHVGGVAGRADEDRVRRTVSEVMGVLRRREIAFRDAGIESMAQFRQLKAGDAQASSAAKAAHADPWGDVFLVVDGYSSVRQDYEALEQSIVNLAAQGLSYGVHLVFAAGRWGDVRPALKDMIGTRLELRLGDPGDSDVGRKVAALVPERRPGRGVTWDGKQGLHTLTALPRIDANSDPDSLPAGVAGSVKAINAAAQQAGFRRANRVRMLPDVLTREELLAEIPAWRDAARGPAPVLQIPVGINESELAPVYVNFAESPHFLIFGDTECGKTTLLRNIAEGIMAANTPQQAMIVTVDFRRTMLGVVGPDYSAAYATNGDNAADIAKGILAHLKRRVAGPDLTPQQLRERSWWSGPEFYILVDDYDLVVTPQGNPLQPLLEYVAQAKDVGLHIVLSRRSGGAGRALFENLLGRIKDVASPGIVMSGSKDEGVLLGTVKPSFLPAGRGTLVARGGNQLIQIASLPPL
jgi:DNA segregation ATPase FtsK/SpoIIIE, S-DNA-T family